MKLAKDVDLVVQLLPENIDRAFTALAGLGYRPIVPVRAAQLADRKTREGWIREKGMQVLQFWSDAHPETPVDMFVSEPFAFDEEYARALVKPIASSEVRFVSIATLIRMKEDVGRPQDLIDADHLKRRLEGNGNG